MNLSKRGPFHERFFNRNSIFSDMIPYNGVILKINFPSYLNYDGKIVHKMRPWARLNIKMSSYKYSWIFLCYLYLIFIMEIPIPERLHLYLCSSPTRPLNSITHSHKQCISNQGDTLHLPIFAKSMDLLKSQLPAWISVHMHSKVWG